MRWRRLAERRGERAGGDGQEEDEVGEQLVEAREDGDAGGDGAF